MIGNLVFYLSVTRELIKLMHGRTDDSMGSDGTCRAVQYLMYVCSPSFQGRSHRSLCRTKVKVSVSTIKEANDEVSLSPTNR